MKTKANNTVNDATVDNTDNNKRIINIIRGTAIFLMLLGHVIQYCSGGQFDFYENVIYKIIYSFHMPLFMIVSGYLFFFSAQKRDMNNLIEYKVKSLLYPILMCSLLNLLLTIGIYPGFREFDRMLGATPITSLWFLWSLLACCITMAFSVKLTNNPIVQSILIFVGILFVALFPNWEMNVYMYPFFVMGYLYARNESRLQKVFNYIGVVSTVAFIMMMFYFEKKHYIYTSGILGSESVVESVRIDLFRWAIGLFGSITIIWLIKLAFIRINTGNLMLGVEKLGKDSLAVYALSVSLLSYWLPIISNKVLSLLPWIDWNRYIWLYNLIIAPAVAIAYSLLFFFIILILKKAGAYRLIFGR